MGSIWIQARFSGGSGNDFLAGRNAVLVTRVNRDLRQKKNQLMHKLLTTAIK